MTQSAHIFPADALPRLGDDWELLRALFHAFQEDAPDKLRMLAAAILAKDLPAIQRNAHTIKGAAAIIGALPCRDLAATLEHCARDGDVGGIEPAWRVLQAEACAVLEALKTPPQPEDSPSC